jgi:hypothetical protein
MCVDPEKQNIQLLTPRPESHLPRFSLRLLHHSSNKIKAAAKIAAQAALIDIPAISPRERLGNNRKIEYIWRVRRNECKQTYSILHSYSVTPW